MSAPSQEGWRLSRKVKWPSGLEVATLKNLISYNFFFKGNKEAYEMVRPLLDASYSSVMYTGGLGTAMIPKVLSNMLCGLQVCAMAEAMLIGI